MQKEKRLQSDDDNLNLIFIPVKYRNNVLYLFLFMTANFFFSRNTKKKATKREEKSFSLNSVAREENFPERIPLQQRNAKFFLFPSLFTQLGKCVSNLLLI